MDLKFSGPERLESKHRKRKRERRKNFLFEVITQRERKKIGSKKTGPKRTYSQSAQ